MLLKNKKILLVILTIYVLISSVKPSDLVNVSAANNQFSYSTMKYGLFVHYVPGATINSSGVVINDINVLANSFDANGFANDVASTGVQYVIFTAWHGGMRPLYPSAVMNKYRPGNCSSRDLIGDMITAIKAKGIRVLLYTHPYLGYHFSDADKTSTGYGAGLNNTNRDLPNWDTFDRTKWNNFLNEVYGELIDKYGSKIDGLFMDEGLSSAQMDLADDFPRLRETIKSKNPNLILLQNFYGTNYSCDIGMKEYCNWGEFAKNNGNEWPCFNIPPVVCFTNNWWASAPLGADSIKYSAMSMFRYTVFEAGCNIDGGGVCWAAGPYSGGGWESGVLSVMKEVGNYMAPIECSIKNTYPSTSYPTRSGLTINRLPYGIVATKSIDDTYEYIHVLTPPYNSKSLILPATSDGKIFSAASLLENGNTVKISQTNDLLILTLQGNDDWNYIDTVIKLKVSGNRGVTGTYKVYSDTDLSIKYFGLWSYSRWERNAGDFEDDMHITNLNGAYFEAKFTGTGVDYIANKDSTQGTSDIYIDGVFQKSVNAYNDTYLAQQALFSKNNLTNGTHILKVVKTGGDSISLDAIGIYSNNYIPSIITSSAVSVNNSSSDKINATSYLNNSNPSSQNYKSQSNSQIANSSSSINPSDNSVANELSKVSSPISSTTSIQTSSNSISIDPSSVFHFSTLIILIGIVVACMIIFVFVKKIRK